MTIEKADIKGSKSNVAMNARLGHKENSPIMTGSGRCVLFSLKSCESG